MKLTSAQRIALETLADRGTCTTKTTTYPDDDDRPRLNGVLVQRLRRLGLVTWRTGPESWATHREVDITMSGAVAIGRAHCFNGEVRLPTGTSEELVADARAELLATLDFAPTWVNWASYERRDEPGVTYHELHASAWEGQP